MSIGHSHYAVECFSNDSSKTLLILLDTLLGVVGRHARHMILDAIKADFDAQKNWAGQPIAVTRFGEDQNMAGSLIVITNKLNGSVRSAWRVDTSTHTIIQQDTTGLKFRFDNAQD
jgi:hypothetical protein